MKRNSQLTKIISTFILVVLSVGIISLIGYSVYRNITRIKPSGDYSGFLTEEGFIKDVAAADYIDVADYKNITVPLSEVEYSDESVETDIATLLNDYTILDKETTALIVDGDKVNIDYIGTVDGVEFEGGNTNGAGTDLVIGSDSYVGGFEDQLIGHGVGDEVTVEVTFPTDYSATELAGKNAVFQVTVNGIYVLPEFTDAFVKENLSEFASTAEGYKEYVKQTKYEDNLSTWIDKYLMDNSTVRSYPEGYIDHLKSVQKYVDQSSYEYMNQLYTSMGYAGMSSFEEYSGMSEAKYDASLEKVAQDQSKKALIYQTIFETEGLTATEDEFPTYFSNIEEDFASQVEQYGKGYLMQQIINKKVIEHLKELVTVK